MKRGELLQQIRRQLNLLSEELVQGDSLEAAQLTIGASLIAGEALSKLVSEDEDDIETAAAEPAQGG